MFADEIQALLNRSLEGDEPARAALMAYCTPVVEQAVKVKLHAMIGANAQRADIEDIRNDIIEHLLRKNGKALASLRNARALDGWLAVLSYHRTVDYLRRNGRRARTAEALLLHTANAMEPPSDYHLSHQELRGELQQLLEAIPPFDRLCVEMHYLQGLKYAEIAEITGHTVNYVSTRLHRARKKLRDLAGDNILMELCPAPISHWRTDLVHEEAAPYLPSSSYKREQDDLIDCSFYATEKVDAEAFQHAFLCFHERCYRLKAWAVLPDSARVLLEPIHGWSGHAVCMLWGIQLGVKLRHFKGRRMQSEDPALTEGNFGGCYVLLPVSSVLQDFHTRRVHDAPVEEGLVNKPKQWRWSSAFPKNAHFLNEPSQKDM